MSKKLQVLADPVVVIFLEVRKFSIQKKLQVRDKSGARIQHLRFFWK